MADPATAAPEPPLEPPVLRSTSQGFRVGPQSRLSLLVLAAKHTGSPRQQLLGFVEFIAADLECADYRGCPFTNTLAELPEVDHPARTLIQMHKQRQFARLIALCTAMTINEPEQVAQDLTLLMEDAQVVAQNKGIERVRSLDGDVISAPKVVKVPWVAVGEANDNRSLRQ